MSTTTLEEMSTDEVANWILTLSGGAKMKQTASDAIKENQLTGEDLAALQSKDDLRGIGIHPLFLTKLWKGIEEKRGSDPNNGNNGNNGNHGNHQNNGGGNNGGGMTSAQKTARKNKGNQIGDKMAQMRAAAEAARKKRNEEQARAAQAAARASQAQAQTSSTAFVVPIVIGNTAKKTRTMFEPWNTVLQLKQAIVDQEGGNIGDLSLICKGKPLIDTNTLQQSGITGLQAVSATFRVRGGLASKSTDNKENESKNESKDDEKQMAKAKEDAILRARLPDFENNKNISPSFEPDCIMGFDEQDTLRVQMPCGHVFDPLTIYQYVDSCLENHHKLEIRCPMPKCEKEWEYGDIVSAADLDDREATKLACVLENRALLKTGDFKECPQCSSMLQRPDKLYMLRIRCVSKDCQNKGDICWICMQPWRSGGFAVCGNKDCHTATVNDDLKIENCGTTKAVTSRSDVECPKLRACPRCLALVGYKEACKHMKCWNCHESFCFICLALYAKDENGQMKWGCKSGGSYSGQCDLAPPQKIE